MKKRIKICQVLASFTFVCMLILSFGIHTNAATEEEEKLKSMKLVSENSFLELYINEEDTLIGVKIKKSGDIWFTNPINGDEDPLATPYNKELMKSHFSLKYYNESVQSSEMNNFSDSIKNGQFEINYLNDGVTITYSLGDGVSKLILPTVISEERYLYYYDQMDDKARKQVKRNYSFLSLDTIKASDKEENLKTYPGLEKQNIYVLKVGTKDYKQEELMEYFMNAGYTANDLENDMIDNGYEATSSKPYFIVPMTYRLEGENLIVSVVPKDILYNTEDYHLIDIDLLEYFGAGGVDNTGYIFVPDGSGALINLNNGKTTKQSYSSPVYGQDRTNNMLATKRSEISENLSVKLPVFGIKTNEKALFAIIEDGEAFSDISADISGRTNSYNNVYAGFNYMQNGAISLGDIVGSNSFYMYTESTYDKEFKVRYAFLSEDEANYSGMANYYRDYLVEREELKKNKVNENLPFYVEYLGAINKTKSFLGIKYQSTEALTTYEQAFNITKTLLDKGINNIKVRYSGWMNGGLGSSAPTKVKSVSKLNKGGFNLNKFLNQMNDLEIPVYSDVDFQLVYKDTLFDGFSMNKLSPRYFDKTVVKTGKYLIPNGFLARKNIKLISSYYLDLVTGKFIDNASKYNLSGISIGNLSTDLFSDFMSTRLTGRQMAVEFNKEAMQKLSTQYKNGIIGNNGNNYSFTYVSDLLDVPMDSNGFYIIDETIPFYEMVIRGYIEFAGKPLNLDDDYTEGILKSIETGAGLYFKWIYADNSALKETEYDYLYSVNYNYWMDKAIDSYTRINEVFSNLQGQTIRNHEKVESGVYKVTYEKGTEILVNYNTYDINYNQATVSGRDFAVIKEGW